MHSIVSSCDIQAEGHAQAGTSTGSLTPHSVDRCVLVDATAGVDLLVRAAV